jgi:tetratricopeptide (TPR) repeat protein
MRRNRRATKVAMAADALFRRAAADHDAGRLAEAMEGYKQVLREDSAHAGAFHRLGLLVEQIGEPAKAEPFLRQALRLRPQVARLHCDLALNLRSLGREAEAARSFLAALALDPADAASLFALAAQRDEAGEPALALYRRALALAPFQPELRNNLGVCLCASGEDGEAALHLRVALLFDPALAEAWYNLGKSLRELGEIDQALAASRRAVAVAPGHAQAHVFLGSLLLLLDRREEGWRHYEWRLGPPRPPAPLAGKRLLLQAEQGFGDMIQFSRYAALAARHGTVTLEVPDHLCRLFRSLPGVAVAARGEPAPEFDLALPLMSLPALFPEAIPPVPYLFAERAAVAGWRARIGEEGRKVGLVWAGSSANYDDRRRSLSSDLLAPLWQVEGVRWFGLQFDQPCPEGVEDLTGNIADFADTAAAIAALDLVIAVDSAVAHLSGALGRPTWVLLHHAADWRWLLGRADSPWYAGMRLYRQKRPGDWTAVMRAVAQDLKIRSGGAGC